MQSILSRAARRPLAQMMVILAAAGAFTACADSTTAPAVNASSLTTANPAEAPSPEAYTTSVDLVVERVADSDAYGTVLRLGVTCSAKTVFDVNVELEQSVKVGKGRQTIQSSNTFTAYACDEGHTSINFMVSPTDAKLTFEPGRGTVHAWIANYQPGVEPADITTRTRIVVD